MQGGKSVCFHCYYWLSLLFVFCYSLPQQEMAGKNSKLLRLFCQILFYCNHPWWISLKLRPSHRKPACVSFIRANLFKLEWSNFANTSAGIWYQTAPLSRPTYIKCERTHGTYCKGHCAIQETATGYRSVLTFFPVNAAMSSIWDGAGVRSKRNSISQNSKTQEGQMTICGAC